MSQKYINHCLISLTGMAVLFFFLHKRSANYSTFNMPKPKTASITAAVSYVNKEKPNILLILTDDQGWGDVSANGNTYLKTPNIDKLALEGARFKNFYVDPVCAPTRAALLTGQYAFRSGAIGVSRGWENMSGNATTIAEILRNNGYRTGHFGKWHNGRNFEQHPLQKGFDEFYGFRNGGIGNYFDAPLEHNDIEKVATKGYIADVLTDSAIGFIKKNRKKPFFCYLPFNTPHTPFQVGDDLFDTYKNMGLSDGAASIYGMVENIDNNVGRLLETIAKQGLTDNTLVIFISDNGPIGGAAKRYNGGMKGYKGSVDEGGVRVPAFFYWKGKIRPGIELKTLAAHIDLLPTLAEISNSQISGKHNLDGINLLPLLKEEIADTLYREVFTMKAIPSAVSDSVSKDSLTVSLRTPKYRFIKHRDGTYKAYDMLNDPTQKLDVYDEGSRKMKNLSARVQKYIDQIPKRYLRRQPICIGQTNAKSHTLYADEAYLGSGVRYFKKFGYNSDWITDFNTVNEKIWWKLDVMQSGNYDVILRYTTPSDKINLNINAGNNALNATINESFQPDFFSVPDRVTASGKSSLRKPWKDIAVGQLSIDSETKKLTLEMASTDDAPIDIRAIILKPNESQTKN